MTKEQRERLHDHHASEALEWDEYADAPDAYSSREDSRKMAAMHRAALAPLPSTDVPKKAVPRG